MPGPRKVRLSLNEEVSICMTLPETLKRKQDPIAGPIGRSLQKEASCPSQPADLCFSRLGQEAGRQAGFPVTKEGPPKDSCTEGAPVRAGALCSS